MREIHFRYTDHGPYTLCGTLLAVAFLWGGVGLLSLVSGTVRRQSAVVESMGVQGIWIIAGAGVCILLGAALLFRLAHQVTCRLFERTGVACFFPQHVEIHRSRRVFCHRYQEIVLKQQSVAPDEDAAEQTGGPLYLKLTLRAGKKKLVLGASVLETEQAHGGFWANWRKNPRRPRTSLDDVLDALQPLVSSDGAAENAAGLRQRLG